jgi:replicative DNA helicase
VRTRAKRLQMERGLGMIVIDYLQLMSGPHKRRENRQQEVSDISRDLKILAKDLNVPIMALSQLSRHIEARHPPIPVLADLHDSGAIEQDADLVMFIYRGDVYQPNEPHVGAQLILAKQRNGPIGIVNLTFHGTFARFTERANPQHERQLQSRLR